MNKLILLIIGVIFFTFSPSVQAQQPSLSGLRFNCLDAKWCNSSACPSGTQHVHRSGLSSTSKKAVTNSKTYITECVDGIAGVVGGVVCTTGNSTLDIELFCGTDLTGLTPAQIAQCDHYSRLRQPDVGYSIDKDSLYGLYRFDKVTNQYVKLDPSLPLTLTVKSDSLGNLPNMEWQSYTPAERMRKFFMWNVIPSTTSVQKEGGGHSIAEIPFIFRSESCSGNSYDPEGRIFDMKTLEPIPNSQITLRQFDSGTMQEVEITLANPNIVNPFFAGKNGHYAFLVVDGYYALSPVSLNYTHAALADAPLLSSNSSKIYYDLYYADSPVIRQFGKMEHRDIVMKPVNNVGYTHPLEILDETAIENNGTYIYSGFLSHPFVLLDIEICSPGTPSTCTFYKRYNKSNGGPDVNGKFKIALDQSVLKSGQYFKRTFTKQNLATAPLSFIQKQWTKLKTIINKYFTKGINIYAQESQETNDNLVSTLEPIPLYIEGFAYDNDGNIIPNATVSIYVTFSERSVYTTNADANGYFRITSEYIPATSYSLRFTSLENPDNVSYQSTSQFLGNNKVFIEKEKIKPFKFASSSTNPRRNVTPSYIPEKKISPLVTNVTVTKAVSPSAPSSPTNTTVSRNPMYLVGAVLMILIAGVGVMLVVYMYKKKLQGNNDAGQ